MTSICFADEQLVVTPPPGYRGGNLPTTPQAIAAKRYHFFPWRSWNAQCSQRRGCKSRSSSSGLRLNDSNHRCWEAWSATGPAWRSGGAPWWQGR